MYEWLYNMRQFLEAGGPVLWLLGLVSALLATLIIERYWYFYRVFRHQVKPHVQRWQARNERSSWAARSIREASLSELRQKLTGNLSLIKTLVALCPLLGLMGTVTGMMTVFDVIAVLGTGNARAMASGISQATIPTMAGMVIALPGLYFVSSLQARADVWMEQVSERLRVSQ